MFFVESCVTSFAHIVIGNLCASMKGASWHIIVESAVQFVDGVGIIMLRWLLQPIVETHAFDFDFDFLPTTFNDDIAIIHRIHVFHNVL